MLSRTPFAPFATAIKFCSHSKNRSSSLPAIQRHERLCMIFSQASFVRAQVERRGLTARLRERREQVRVIEMHGSSDSHLISSWAFGSVTTTTAPPGASPVAIYQLAFGMNS